MESTTAQNLHEFGLTLLSQTNEIKDEIRQFDSVSKTELETLIKLLSDSIEALNAEIVDLTVKEAHQRMGEFEVIDVRREDEYFGELAY